ncbi:MAG: L-seryl-tRNA(Sec) selenium transferase, partial [Candidatus Aenigmatarchaeota archaeon]
MISDPREYLKKIPQISKLLKNPRTNDLLNTFTKGEILEALRTVTEEIRRSILSQDPDKPFSVPPEEEIIVEVERRLKQRGLFSLKKVINGTGIIVHTNLGRAPLPDGVLSFMTEIGRSYSNLEYDLEKGERGERYIHVESIIKRITGAEASLPVNNNAAAVLLVLNTLASGKEVVVSRGELVEIGGSFRIPDVMRKSGAQLIEVGTTNRTYIRDYEEAINERTALLLKVHRSNFRLVGFTHEVTTAELVSLGKRNGIPVMVDLGSGSLLDFSLYGIEKEPTVQECIKDGADIITFSGDKLLGGPQAGIILGKKIYLDLIKKNPLHRALRIDKLTLSCLEALLMIYLDQQEAVKRIPVLRMITESSTDVMKRAKKVFQRLRKYGFNDLQISLREDYSQAGGGSLPAVNLPTWVISIKSRTLSENV